MRTDDPRRQPKNRIKARIGEAIIESLLEEAGNKVRRFGQEWRTTTHDNLVPGIFRFVSLPDRVRMKPDLAIRTSSGQLETVEVKFMITDLFLYPLRDSGYFEKLLEHWPATRIVVVSLDGEPLIQVLNPPYIADGDFASVPIYEVPGWGVTKDLYDIYERLIQGLPADELANKKGGA